MVDTNNASDNPLRQAYERGEFIVTSEIAPPDGAHPELVVEAAKAFGHRVHAINVTDSSGAHCHMGALAVSAILQQYGYTAIMQMACRDRNRIAMQADVLGAAALGVRNMLCLTGDGVQTGDHPQSMPVFDLDSLSLLSTVRHMRDQKCFLSGRGLKSAPDMWLGGASNPFVPPLKQRVLRMRNKIEAGAQFFQTQYCFDLELLRDFMAQVREQELHKRAMILIGVGPLPSARTALWMRNNVPGVHIPDALIHRLKDATDPKEEGLALCAEMIREVRDIEGVDGVHIMAYRQEKQVPRLIELAS